MSKYFDKAVVWSEEVKDTKGLPRPFSIVNSLSVQNQKVPIPWQSKTDSKWHGFYLLQEHEDRVIPEGLCGYCGVSFSPTDNAILWIKREVAPAKGTSRVASDYHPFHEECMEEARIFCPHMKLTEESEFKKGSYKELREETDSYLKEIGA